MRLLSAVLCAAAAWWLLPCPFSDACPAGPTPQGIRPEARLAPAEPVAPDGCKPLAPIDVELTTPDGAGPGPVRAVASVSPRLAMQSVAWHWELSADVRVARGELAGEAAPERGERTAVEIDLLVPDDGRPHRAELVVTGRLRATTASGVEADAASDAEAGAAGDGAEPVDVAEPELVTLVRTLRWGPMPEPGPVVSSPDAESGTWQAFVAMPSRHTPASATQVAPDGGR